MRCRAARAGGGAQRRARRRGIDELDHPINLNLGVLRGGDWPSTVAAECTLSCRLALFPGQQAELAPGRAAVQRDRRIRSSPGTHRRTLRRLHLCRAEIAAMHPLVTTLSEQSRAARGRAHPSSCRRRRRRTPGSFLHEGIPAVCFGAWAENAHGVDERVNIPSMISAAQVMAVFIRDWCGVVG